VEVSVGDSTVLETIGADGTGARVLATIDAAGIGGGFSWSPGGAGIAYSSGRQLWTVSDGAGASPVAVTPLSVTAATPFWSPDGRRLAFMDATPDGVGYYLSRVWVRDLAGGPEFHLADLASGTGPDGVTWSPDGRWLAFVERQWPTYRVLQVPVNVPFDGGPLQEVASFTGQGPMDPIARCPVSWQRLPVAPSP
jgi:Tol biopolymer transport system component